MARTAMDCVDRRALDSTGHVSGSCWAADHNVETRRLRWSPIATRLFGTRVAAAPVRGASLLGDDVVIAHCRHVITSAPHVQIVVGVDPADEQSSMTTPPPPATRPTP